MLQCHFCRKTAAGVCDATQIMRGPTRLECKFLTGLATMILDESGWGVPDFPAAPHFLATNVPGHPAHAQGADKENARHAAAHDTASCLSLRRALMNSIWEISPSPFPSMACHVGIPLSGGRCIPHPMPQRPHCATTHGPGTWRGSRPVSGLRTSSFPHVPHAKVRRSNPYCSPRLDRVRTKLLSVYWPRVPPSWDNRAAASRFRKPGF